MKAYIEPIQTALLFFPFVAFLFTVPYMAYQYYRYGSIPILRSVVVYSFILYLMCAGFLTVLPLPDIEKVRGYTSARYQLVPFRELAALFQNPAVRLGEPATWYKFFWNRVFFQIVANICLTIPFGIYLRYYFGMSLKKTALLSFALSFLFELVQFTGLFFIYPRPYRLADVDDLMTNTLGGVLGYLVAPLVTRPLPSRERINNVAFQRSKRVSLIRRLFAAMVDCVLLFLLVSVLFFSLPRFSIGQTTFAQKLLIVFGGYTFFVLLYFGVLVWALGGRSPGKFLSRIKLVDTRTMGRPKLWQCVVRYSIFYLVVAPAPVMVLLMVMLDYDPNGFPVPSLVACILLMLLFVGFCGFCVFQSFVKGGRLPHGWFSKTDDVSTLSVASAAKRARKKRAGKAADI